MSIQYCGFETIDGSIPGMLFSHARIEASSVWPLGVTVPPVPLNGVGEPIGAPFVGWHAGHYGPRAPFFLGGSVTLLVAGVALAYRLRLAGGRVRLRLLPLPKFSVVLPEKPA